MYFSDAIDANAKVAPDDFSSLSEVLSPELIDTCLEEAGVATLRKRRLPLEMVVWAVVGMALFRHIPIGQIVNHLDIILPGKRPFVAPRAVVQARQWLGVEPVKRVFEKTQALWHRHTPHSHWCGLTLLGVDGVVWRTPDSPENQAAFARTGNAQGEASYPQIRMVCQMELTSHLLTGSVFDSVARSEMELPPELIASTPDHSLSRQDRLVTLTASPQARKKWPDLPPTMKVHLLRRKVNGKEVQILTSLTAGTEIDDAYLGGERPGKRGRGAEHKFRLVAAVQTDVEGHPQRVQLRRVSGFNLAEIRRYAQQTIAPGSDDISDGLGCFRAFDTSTYVHERHITGVAAPT